MRARTVILCASVLAFLWTSFASAVAIPVSNPSFEEDLGHAYPIPWYWQGAGERAAANPAPAPDGTANTGRMSTGAYAPHDPGDGGQTRVGGVSDVEQTLATLAAPNTTYTLTIDAVNSNAVLGDSTHPIRILPLLHHADGTALGGMSGNDLLSAPVETSPVLNVNTWSTLSFTWTTDGTEAGTQFLRVGFAVDQSFIGTVAFDNVRLDATPVPEPSMLALLATGSVVLLPRAWRKRR